MKKTECVIYESKVQLPERLPKTKRGFPYMTVGIAVLGLICTAIFVGIFSTFWGGSSAGNGFLFWNSETEESGSDELPSEESENESREGAESQESEAAESESASEPESEESTTDMSQQETEEETKEQESTVWELDLSEAEKGDGYLINYSEKRFDTEGILSKGFEGAQKYYSEAPVVLILHAYTHTAYADADPDKASDTFFCGVVSVGERVAKELNRRGVPTVHCTVIHEENDAYASAAETVRSMKEIYPSIQYVIDLGRIGELTDIGTGNTPVHTRSALDTAQIRLTVSAEGSAVKESLSLALCLRRELNRYDRRLCMPTVVTDNIYFDDPPLCYLKLDVGASGNTSAEAVEAGGLFAEALADVLKK